MKKQEYKSFAELYTNIIKCVSDTSNIPIDIVIKKLSNIENNIKQEYEHTLIMKESYYINKFIN